MSINFHCESCKKKIKAPDPTGGKWGKCPYCQLFHTGVAKLHGASDEELAEIYFLASFSSRWSAIIHAQNYDYDKFEEEIHKIGAHLSK